MMRIFGESSQSYPAGFPNKINLQNEQHETIDVNKEISIVPKLGGEAGIGGLLE
jgi:hypothetical protein